LSLKTSSQKTLASELYLARNKNMSSKSRNGLSKREYAAKQAGGNLNYKTGKISAPKKSSSKSSSSNPYSKYQSMDGWANAVEAYKKDYGDKADLRTGGAFDIAMNQTWNSENAKTMYDPNDVRDMGNLENWTPKQGRALDENYTSADRAKVQASQKNFGTPTPVSNPTLQRSEAAAAFNPEGADKAGSPQSTPNVFAGQDNLGTLRQLLGNGYYSNGVASNGKNPFGIEGSMTGTESDEQSFLNSLLGIPTAKAAESSLYPDTSKNSIGVPYTGYSNTPYGGMSTRYGIDTPHTGYSNTPYGGMSTRYGIDTPPVFQNTSNEEYTPKPTNQQSLGGSNSGGVAQQYSQQVKNPQQEYYEQAIKNAKKVMKETIKALEKEYAESERTGTDALNKQKREDLQAQSARFSFGLNQDPNSEQAMQYAQRTSNDYAGQLADFLKKLSTAKSQDISSAKQNYYSQKDQAQQQLAQLMAQLQTKAAKVSGGYSGGSTKISHNDIFNYVNDAISSGGSWQEIADDAASQGIDTSTGSYFDQLMNQANKQNRWA
jgi:hypothetical protein